MYRLFELLTTTLSCRPFYAHKKNSKTKSKAKNMDHVEDVKCTWHVHDDDVDHNNDDDDDDDESA